jgi:transposase-like protein
MRDLSKKYFALIEKQQSSNLTMKAFSERNGINVKTLYYWKKKYAERQKVAGRLKKNGFTALSVEGAVKETEVVIQYPDGTILTLAGISAAALVKQFLPAFKS